ncbi:hypothetical protein [Delftia tsuruhatensis]|uniref:hypothetical protein n=1 Tax=Delftia tsuruhatensis TaxID=180282 RepID=UPI002028BADC|nr:hypothetical protein [Delftia tsuruhatensis]
MKELHFYILAIGAICISGFSFGLTWGRQELTSRAIQRRNAAGVKEPMFLGDSVAIPKDVHEAENHEDEFAKNPSLIQIVLSFVVLAYAIAWGITFVDGAYFVWIPGVFAWWICNKRGRDFYCKSYKQYDFHLYTSIIATVCVVAGYYYLKSLKSASFVF